VDRQSDARRAQSAADRIWVSLLKVPYRFLFPAIMVFSCIGIYSTNNASFDIYLTAIFGLLASCGENSDVVRSVDARFRPRTHAEENLRRAMLISRGDPSVFVTRPISLMFIIITVLILIVMAAPALRKRRDIFTG